MVLFLLFVFVCFNTHTCKHGIQGCCTKLSTVTVKCSKMWRRSWWSWTARMMCSGPCDMCMQTWPIRSGFWRTLWCGRTPFSPVATYGAHIYVGTSCRDCVHLFFTEIQFRRTARDSRSLQTPSTLWWPKPRVWPVSCSSSLQGSRQWSNVVGRAAMGRAATSPAAAAARASVSFRGSNRQCTWSFFLCGSNDGSDLIVLFVRLQQWQWLDRSFCVAPTMAVTPVVDGYRLPGIQYFLWIW